MAGPEHIINRIHRELLEVPEEERAAACRELESGPDFPGWNCCPFGGWNLWILGMVHRLRKEREGGGNGRA